VDRLKGSLPTCPPGSTTINCACWVPHETTRDLAHQLNQSDANIEVVRDGVEALELLLGSESRPRGAQDALPRLILLDLNMPRLNGFEVLERLRADDRTRLLPVVVFSASNESSDEREAHRLGASGYVRKPASFEKLRATLAQLEREWLSANAAS
jgi:CheY-like chemotaxis protein